MLLSAVAFVAFSVPLVEKDLVYRKVGETELKYDYYKPGESVDNHRFVVAIHGGGWTQGTKEQMAPLCENLAKQGFHVATVQYRLAPTHKWPAQIDDVQSAVRFFRSQAKENGYDEKLIGAIGPSAGGHLSLLLGFTDTRDSKTEFLSKESSQVKAVVNLFGPTDLSQDYNPVIANVLSQQVLGKPYKEATEEVKSFSPIKWIGKGNAPVFTMHGKADPLVPVKQAERLDEALKKAGISHEMHLIPGMGHEVNQEIPECVDALIAAVKFLNKNLQVSE